MQKVDHVSQKGKEVWNEAADDDGFDRKRTEDMWAISKRPRARTSRE